MLSSEKRNAVLIEYFITKDEAFIFIVSSRDKELHIESVPLSEQELKRYVEVFEREMVDYDGAIGDAWLDLSSYLIEPIGKYLSEDDLIYFVPYGLLHYIPMHALELNGEPLIKKHPVAYSPSASLLQFSRKKGSSKLKTCASFGVKFEDEAKGVAQLFNTKARNERYATKDRVCENCTDKDIIHFSCHGRFDNIDPLSSGVVLYDGVLTAREIFDMRLNTELVTLSACQTGLNERSPGDELIGLTRAFLYAGAPSVIVSLWSVDAGSAQELMLEFYRLLKNGSDKATALQKAQKKIMAQEGGQYSHPYYWAPFVLVGDWQ
jgi:CHAT domain-containing protein